jgi:hypothetical protein
MEAARPTLYREPCLDLKLTNLIGAAQTQHFNDLPKTIRQGHKHSEFDQFLIGEIFLPAREIAVAKILVALCENGGHFQRSSFAPAEDRIVEVGDRADLRVTLFALLNLSRSDRASIMAPAEFRHPHPDQLFQQVIHAPAIKGAIPGVVKCPQGLGFTRQNSQQRGVGRAPLFGEAKIFPHFGRDTVVVGRL